MSQFASVQTFADTGPNAEVNGSRMNSHVNDATALNGIVLDQAEKTLPVAADFVLLGDSTVAASGFPKKVLLSNLPLESQRNGTQQYVASDTGAANAYVVALSPAATAYTAGMVVRFKAGNANTTASTINVNGLGVKSIKTRAGGDPAANDILANQIVELVYDGTNFQHTNAISAGEVTATQATESFRSGVQLYAADGGSANAYTMTLAPAATAYTAGMTVRIKISNTNTTASTLNVNALGLKTIKKIVAGAVADIKARDLQAGDLVTLVYDGTYFLINGQIRSWDFVSAGTDALPGSAAKADIAHGLGAVPTKLRVVLVQTGAGADQGYAQNDEVDLFSFQNTANSNQAFSISADATNVTVSQTNNGNITIVPKTGGGHADVTTEANWKIKVYASL